MKTSCYKVKSGKTTKIPAKICGSKKQIDSLLDMGYAVSKVTETKDGSKTRITTFSPQTRIQAWEQHKRRWGPGVPF